MSDESINPQIKSNQSNLEVLVDENGQNQKAQGRWSEDQHYRFLTGVMQFGKDWKQVEKVVKSRTGTQVRSHAQKYFLKFRRQQKQKKRNKNKQYQGPTELEQEILQYFSEKDITSSTPPQISIVLQIPPTIIRGSIHPNIDHEIINYGEGIRQEFKGKDQRDRLIFNDKRVGYDRTEKDAQIVINPLFCSQSLQTRMKIDKEDSYLLLIIKNNLNLFREGMGILDLTDFKVNDSHHKQVSPQKSFKTLKNQEEQKLLKTKEKDQHHMKNPSQQN